MTTAAKSSNSSIQPYTDGSCLILKRVRFANGKLYDVRIRKNAKDGQSIAFGQIAATTLSQVQKAVVDLFQGINDPNPVSFSYRRNPEDCVLTNRQFEIPYVVNLLDPKRPELLPKVEQVRNIYKYLLPQKRTGISLDPDAQLVKEPIQISAAEADRWNNRTYRKETPTPSAPEKTQPLPKTKTTPLPESDAHASAPERTEASAPVMPTLSKHPATDRLLFKFLDEVPLKYKGQEIKYTELYNYYSLFPEQKMHHKLSPFMAVLQKVIGSPEGDDEKEIRKWILDLYQVAYKFYSEYSKYDEQERRQHAARVLLTFSLGVDIKPYFEKLMSHAVPLTIRIGSTALSVESGDITHATGVKAIVNAANRSCLGGGGVDKAIHDAAGPDLINECKKLPSIKDDNGIKIRCDTGRAVTTRSGNLKKRGIDYVIHAVGPDCRKVSAEEAEELLREAYWYALNEAQIEGIRSVAFPAISAGAYEYPLEEATQVALETIEEYLEENPGQFDTIKLIFTPEDYDEAAKVFSSKYPLK